MTLPGYPWTSDIFAKLVGYRRFRQDGANPLEERSEVDVISPLQVADTGSPDFRTRLSIDPVALIPEVPTANTIWVDPINGNDGSGEPAQEAKPYATISAANAAATAQIPTASNPWLISLRPGIHTTAPVTLQPYVTIGGVDGCETAVVQASTPTAPLITGADGAVVKNVTLQGADGAGGIGVLMAVAGTCRIEGCCIRDCETGAVADGTGGPGRGLRILNSDITRASGETLDRAVVALDGGIVNATGCTVVGSPGANVTRAFVSDGTGSLLIVGSHYIGAFADSGLYAENDGVIIAQGGLLDSCDRGVHIPISGGQINALGLSITNSAIEDVDVVSPSTLVTADLLISSEPTLAAGATWFGTRFNAAAERTITEGNYQVGAPGRPGRSCFGEGCDHVVGLTALQEDFPGGPGDYRDITADIVSETGSAIEVFLSADVDNRLFIGGTQPFPGLFIDTVLATPDTTIALEYYDGATWQPLPWMTTAAAAPQTSSGNTIFAAAAKENVRWEVPSDWAILAIDGLARYWMRFITDPVIAPTTNPQVESMALHVDSSVVHGDGYLEHRGAGEYVQVWPGGDLPIRHWESSGVAPTATTFAVDSANVVEYSIYQFGNAQTRQINNAFVVPPGADTSRPVLVEIEWDPGASLLTGNVAWTVRYITFASGDVVDGTGTASIVTVLSAAPGLAYQGVRAVAEIPIPGVASGHDTLVLQVQRQGGVGGDTFGAAARLRSVRVLGTHWAAGEQEA
jgi:hypothetical protein